ncbi:hypothetical protein BSKO_10019 [Bryopsis sp. KO-2023]|nr:hypothetical protein BSKO_10019 [Bryopsis sp. KO-2023]
MSETKTASNHVAVSATQEGRDVTLRPLNSAIGPDGLVKYDLLLQDSSDLDHNIEVISSYSDLDPVGKFTQKDLAFYCNAYNMWCLSLACKKLRKTKGTWKGNVGYLDKASMFYFSTVVVAGMKMNLLKLENDIIRKYNDPRIHFAINCASWSCPRLPQRMFEGELLDTQFDERAKKFINRDGGVIVKDGKVSVNPIFKWFKADFEEGGGVIAFINKYIQGEAIDSDAKIAYQDYDWSLNSTKNVKNSK